MHVSSTRFVTPPEELSSLPGVDDQNALLVDFDETLWLRNSTEEFLGLCRPRKHEKAVLAAIEGYGPWRLARRRHHRSHWRDWMRVAGCVALNRRHLQSWSDAATELGPLHANREITKILHRRDREVVVLSNGFEPLIRPLLDAMGCGHARLLAAPIPNGALWRLRGKLPNARRALGDGFVESCTVITDSADDLDILHAARHGYLVKWPQAEFRPYSAARTYRG